MLFRSGRQHLERRIRHGRFSRPLAPLAASQTVEAVSPCCRYSRAGTRCLGREAGRDFGAEARPAKAANSRLGETAAWRTRVIDRGCRPVPVGSRLLWTPGIRGRLAMERNGPSAPDVFVIVARPTTAPILSRAASPEHAIERACAFWHSPGCRPKPWGWTVGPGRSNSRSAGQAQDSVARAWRQLRVAKRSTGGQHDQPRLGATAFGKGSPNASLRVDASVAVMAPACLRACQG